jgi:hypothetical protein
MRGYLHGRRGRGTRRVELATLAAATTEARAADGLGTTVVARDREPLDAVLHLGLHRLLWIKEHQGLLRSS